MTLAKVIFRPASLRQGPGIFHAAIATIPLDVVIDGEIKGNWLQTSYGGKEGYIAIEWPNMVGRMITRLEIPPKPDIFKRLRHDHETQWWDFTPRVIINYKGWKRPPRGIPSTLKSYGSGGAAITPDLVELQMGIFRYIRPDWSEKRILRALEGFWKADRAFTNYSGWTPGGGGSIEIPLTTTGNIVKLTGNTMVKRIPDRNYKKVEVEFSEVLAVQYDKRVPLPGVRYLIQRPWLLHYATNQTREVLADGTWRVEEFPQLDGAPVRYPFLSRTGTAWFPTYRMDDDVTAGPYNK